MMSPWGVAAWSDLMRGEYREIVTHDRSWIDAASPFSPSVPGDACVSSGGHRE